MNNDEYDKKLTEITKKYIKNVAEINKRYESERKLLKFKWFLEDYILPIVLALSMFWLAYLLK